MWQKGWRDQVWDQLGQPWDLLVIGGGITGAGIFREAVSAGLRVLLVEAQDFSSGTSSRSSKLIHGGFRYMRNKQFNVTFESVREREWMLKEAVNLVTPLQFLMPNYESYRVPSWQFGVGVILYDLFAPKWNHHRVSFIKTRQRMPYINQNGFISAFDYFDACVDDSRLVLRILQETVGDGGTALSYAKVNGLLTNRNGKVEGVQLVDTSGETERSAEIRAAVVVNATGPWGDQVRAHLGAAERLRKLRGSHLVLPREKLPLPHGVTLMHPRDRRAMFALPWEGVSIIGTTDLDHKAPIENPRASAQEITYMLEALNATFPALDIQPYDVISSFSGLRPIVSIGAADPSKESRAHVVWEENGLFTISGGKITTFRIMARDLLEVVRSKLHSVTTSFPTGKRIFAVLPRLQNSEGMDQAALPYLLGRYGRHTGELLQTMDKGDMSRIAELPNFWGELRWAARNEGAVHLDDLLLRRIRLGLQLPQGGMTILSHIRRVVQVELGWSDERWEREVERYQQIWQEQYSPMPNQNVFS